MSDEPDVTILTDLPPLDVYIEDRELKDGEYKVRFPDKYPNLTPYRRQSFKALCMHYFGEDDPNLITLLDFLSSYAKERSIHLTLENIFEIDTSTRSNEEKVWLQHIRTNYNDILKIIFEFPDNGKLCAFVQFLENRIPDEKSYAYLETRIESILKSHWDCFDQDKPSFVSNETVPQDIQSIVISTITFLRSIPIKDIENMRKVMKPDFVLCNSVLVWFLSMFLYHKKFNKQPIREISKETSDYIDIIFSQLED
jgi:hypothetical protein